MNSALCAWVNGEPLPKIAVEKLTSKSYCQKISEGRSVEEDGDILSNQIADR
jgi:hypothetical protein